MANFDSAVLWVPATMQSSLWSNQQDRADELRTLYVQLVWMYQKVWLCNVEWTPFKVISGKRFEHWTEENVNSRTTARMLKGGKSLSGGFF